MSTCKEGAGESKENVLGLKHPASEAFRHSRPGRLWPYLAFGLFHLFGVLGRSDLSVSFQ